MKDVITTMVIVVTLALVASADVGDELAKLTALDAAAGDGFGYSVAISGNTAIVGACYDDDAGTSSGSAYLFNATTGNQIAKLTASDAASVDRFGRSVAIDGNTAIVGANGNDAGPWSGSAYLFDITTGNQLAKLTASDAAADDLFGESVAISGNTAIVGAADDDDGGSMSGSAYLFNATTGNQIAKLTASDAAAGDSFGVSVAISGNTAIVGARYDDDGGSMSGSAYLFDITTGNQLAKLTASDAATNDLFGRSVAVDGNTAIVGAIWDNPAGLDSGSAYLFDITTGDQLAKLTASDAAAHDYFGYSVAISANTAIVGAYANDDDGSHSGSAYLFDITTGNQLAKLTALDAAAADYFGTSVAISGDTAIVGAHGNDDDGSQSGSAYLYAVGEPAIMDIGIDIRPGSEQNPVNLRSNGVLSVAILGNDQFDVYDIDLLSLLLNDEATPRQKGKSEKVGSFRDVNGDGLTDLILQFWLNDLDIAGDATELILEGLLNDYSGSLPFRGVDSIRLVGLGNVNSNAVVVGSANSEVLSYSDQSSLVAIPEPATLSLLLLSGLALLRRRLVRR